MAPLYTNNFDLAPVGLYAPGAMFQGWSVLSNLVDVLDDYTCFCLSNHVLGLLDGGVSNSLPTTNAVTAPASNPYTLTYRVNHLPWLEGMVTWWPLDVDGSDIFGGLNGLLYGDVAFSGGEVNQAFIGDGLATRMIVPRCPELDVGRGRGFSIEGWINPAYVGPLGTIHDSSVIAGPIVNSANGHLYYLLPTNSWTASEAKAVSLGGHLVTIRSQAEQNFVYTNFGNFGGVARNLWMGMRRSPSNYNLFVWASGEPVTYTNWAPGEPNNCGGVETRVMMYSSATGAPGKWNDATDAGTSGCDGSILTGGWPYGVVEVNSLSNATPLVEWYDTTAPTNQSPLGVQFWLSGLPGTNAPGALWANIWDTNLQPHIISTGTNALTNGVWQHVALTYDTNSASAVLYTNGQPAATVQFPTNFVPRTSADLYLGFHPPKPTNSVCFAGGLDEFSVYQRALSPCEVNAIFNAGSRGKYGTNVLVCPVATEVTLLTASGSQTYAFTNGLTWTNNGPLLGNQHHLLLHLHQPDRHHRPRTESLQPGGYQLARQPECRGG